ncbi:hypothetical protein N7510_000313 [Penicillium lagena]|uniref:uncharacterized protein n=1 Tax=Penicillium lagena TaxID=94218 RepID=UPI00254165BD|nr:uncharacterized protein N7510_000313 [Penicillium lagena]KAJ5624004.1 hypothetical protein N7510_000313 [Penicillium lagena]
MESPASSPEQVPERFVQDQIPDWNESRLNSNEETLDQANLSSLRDLNFIGDDLPAFVAGQGDLTSLMDDSTAFL